MFIDIHAHAFRKPFLQIENRAPWPNAAQLIEFYDKIGVEKAVLLPLVSPEFYLPQSNEDILEAAEQFPGRFIPFCNIHPKAFWNDAHTKLEDAFKLYRDAGCKGVGEVTCNMSFLDPFMVNLFRAIEVMEWPMTIHVAHRYGRCYGIYDEPGLPGLAETLDRFPKMKIFAHSQTFWAEIGKLDTPYERAGYPSGKIVEEGAVPKLLRKHPNLYGDLSAGSGCNSLTRDEDYAIKFLNEFQDRLMFGIDICSAPCEEHKCLANFLQKLLAEKKISQTVFDKIARGNAIRLLNL